MSTHVCVLRDDLQDRVKDIGDGTVQDGVLRLLDHWDAQPTEAEEQAATEQAVAEKQAELREKFFDETG